MYQLDEVAIANKFQGDVDDISSSFIAAYSLKFKQEVGNLSSPLLRWLDFRFRYVNPQPRQVVLSDKFPKTNLPQDAKAGLEILEDLIRKGQDINPYQGRGLILRNDTSGLKNESRTDLLWADWNILHFHLSANPIPCNQFFSHPADYLAFCIVGGDVVAFIDVLRHPGKKGFANPELMDTVHRNWPDHLEQFRLNGILSDSSKSMADIHSLRVNGIGCLLTFGGKAYMTPGMGVTTASTSLKITVANDHVRKYVRALAQMVCDPGGKIQREIISFGISDPNFALVVTPQGLAVYEEGSGYAFLLPVVDQGKESTFLDKLRNLIAPDWAVKFLLSSTSS